MSRIIVGSREATIKAITAKNAVTIWQLYFELKSFGSTTRSGRNAHAHWLPLIASKLVKLSRVNRSGMEKLHVAEDKNGKKDTVPNQCN